MDFTLHPIKREIELKGFHSIYYFEFGKEFSHPPEKHGFWEMVYVDSGEINAVTDGLGRKLRQGQVIFHRPWEVHAHVSNLIDPNNMLVVSFTANSPAMEFFDKRIFTLGKTEKTLLSLFVKEARVALGAIPDDYHDKRALDFSSAPRGSFQLLECYLTEFLLVLLRGGDEASSTVAGMLPDRVFTGAFARRRRSLQHRPAKRKNSRTRTKLDHRADYCLSGGKRRV